MGGQALGIADPGSRWCGSCPGQHGHPFDCDAALSWRRTRRGGVGAPGSQSDSRVLKSTGHSKEEFVGHTLWRLVLSPGMDPFDGHRKWIPREEVDHGLVGVEHIGADHRAQRCGAVSSINCCDGERHDGESGQSVPPRMAEKDLPPVRSARVVAPVRNHVE